MTPPSKPDSPALVEQPHTHRHILAGVEPLVRLIRPTLGPLPRSVLFSSQPSQVPEALDSGGQIARRYPAGGNGAVGAALLKNALVKLDEQAGDGVASAAVIFDTIFRRGVSFIAQGGNGMLLRRGLEAGLQVIGRELDSQRLPLQGRAGLERFALCLRPDAELADALAEVFDVLGETGRLEINPGNTRTLEREYVDGFYWQKGMLLPGMANHPVRAEAHLVNPAVLLTNYFIHDPAPLAYLLDAAVSAGFTSLLLVALGINEKTLGVLMTPANREKIHVVAVEPPFTGADRDDFIQDVAVLTGTTPILRAGDIETELVFSSLRNLKFVRPEDFGRARRVWCTGAATGISGGKADPAYLRHYQRDLQRRYQRETDETLRRKLRSRLGLFHGGSATLWVGGVNTLEIQQRRAQAEASAQALRGAIRSGVLPGGGSSLLACRPALAQRLAGAASLEERMAYQILLEAVQAPARTLLQNAGVEPAGRALAEIEAAGPGWGYNVLAGRIQPMIENGIFDGADVVHAAVQTAVSAASMALSTEVIIPARRAAGGL
jgi:chaperonin GroEL